MAEINKEIESSFNQNNSYCKMNHRSTLTLENHNLIKKFTRRYHSYYNPSKI